MLIRLIREKHPDGAAALYDMYGASLYGVIFRIITDVMLSEDVLQETFIRVWQSFALYDPAKGRLFTWMVNIARRQAIDLLRSKNYKKDLKTGELMGCDELLIAPVNYYDRADRAQVRQAVTLLADPERVVLELIYFRGYTHTEAAEALKMPLGTVKTCWLRAIKKLRGYYVADTLSMAS